MIFFFFMELHSNTRLGNGQVMVALSLSLFVTTAFLLLSLLDALSQPLLFMDPVGPIVGPNILTKI